MLYYGSKLIADQAPITSMTSVNVTEIHAKFFTNILGLFISNPEGLYHATKNRYIYDKLINFTKGEQELAVDLDRWLHVLKNMSEMDKLPTYLRKPVFEKLFAIAAYTKLNKEERDMYNASLKNKWDAESI